MQRFLVSFLQSFCKIHMAINSSSTVAMEAMNIMPEWAFMALMSGIGLVIVVPMLFKKNIRDMFVGGNMVAAEEIPPTIVPHGEDML